MAILQDNTKPTYEMLLAMMAKQQAELDALKAAKHTNGISFKVNEFVKDPETGKLVPGSRGLSIYGLGKRPLFAYASQWLRILDKADDLRAFIEANRDKLAWKE